MNEEEHEEAHAKTQAFLAEFKQLVRKYAKEDDIDLLYMLQDRTSVFNPYVWSD